MTLPPATAVDASTPATTTRRRVAGFTLIEILIAVAIVGVLAAIALPSYSDSLVRARVSEGLSLASAAQKAVALSAMEGNGDLAEGYHFDAGDRNVANIAVDGGDGLITVTYTARSGAGTIELKPTQDTGAPLEAGKQSSGEVHWSCTGGTLQPRHRPASCRP